MFKSSMVTFTAGENLERYRRVKILAGSAALPPEVVHAAAGEAHVGTTDDSAEAGDVVTVRLANDPGTHEVEAAEAVTVGALVYGADNGKAGVTVSGDPIGVARSAASGDGVILEIVPQ